jgi:hypothetical protein
MSAAALSAVPAAPSSAIATGVVDYDPFGDAPKDGVIEIQAMADTRVPSNLVVNVAISDVDKNPFQTRYVEDDEALEVLVGELDLAMHEIRERRLAFRRRREAVG